MSFTLLTHRRGEEMSSTSLACLTGKGQTRFNDYNSLTFYFLFFILLITYIQTSPIFYL